MIPVLPDLLEVPDDTARRSGWPRGGEWWWLLPPVLLAAVFACYPLYSTDTWWHLAAGRLIAQTGSVPRVDPFLYTSPGRRWIDYSWSAQWLFYEVYTLGGVTGLIALRMMTAALGLALAWLLAVRRGCPPWLAAIVCAGLLSTVDTVLHVRPFLLSAVAAGGILLALEAGGWGGLAAAAGLQLWWANLHASFFLGPVMAGFLAGEATLAHFFPGLPTCQRGRTDLRHLWLAVPALLLVSLINPNGTDLFFMSQQLIDLGWDRRLIDEMLPIHLDLTYGRRFAASVILAGAAVVVALVRRGRLGWANLCLAAIFAQQALQSRRFVFYWGFLAVVPLAEALALALPRPRRLRLCCGGLLAAVALAGLSESWLDLLGKGGFSWSVAPRIFPEAAADFLDRQGIAGHVLCDPAAGGYLAWRLPRVQPSNDSRFGDNDFAQLQRVLALTGNRADWRLGVPSPGESDVMLLPTRILTPLGEIYDEWAVVYWDNSWQVLLRRTRYPELVAQYDCSRNAPFALGGVIAALSPTELSALVATYRQRVAADPECGSAYFGLGQILRYQALLELVEMRRNLVELEKSSGRGPAAEARRAQAERRGGEGRALLYESLDAFGRDMILNRDSVVVYAMMEINLLLLGEPGQADKIAVELAGAHNELLLAVIGREVHSLLPFIEQVFGHDSVQAQDFRRLIQVSEACAQASDSAVMQRLREPGLNPAAWMRPAHAPQPQAAETQGK